MSCSTGLGLCRRSGVLNCDTNNPAGAPICDAEIVAPDVPGVDACDYQDDDCDGQVDESFIDENGRYTQVENCGACGTDCTALWDPTPEAFGVVPTCANIAGTTQCSYTCIDGFIDADGVASNGVNSSPMRLRFMFKPQATVEVTTLLAAGSSALRVDHLCPRAGPARQ